jgi:hypothetical protein
MKTPINKDNLDQLFNKAKADKQGLDDFEKDAIEGFDMLESEKEAADLKASLDTLIQKELFAKEEERNPKVYWFAAAGLILVVGLSVLFVLNNNDSLSNSHDVAIINNAQESEKNVLPDSKAELKEQAVTPPTEAVTVTDEESPAKIFGEKLKTGKLDLQDQTDGKDMAATTKVAKDEQEAKPRMIVGASTKGPVDIKQVEKEQSERKKEEVADEMVATGSGSNSKSNNNTGGLGDLSKGSKDKEGEAFKSIPAKTPDQKIKSAETESTPKNEVAFGTPKEKAKKEDRKDNDAEEDLNQPVAVNMDKNASVNREEKAGKKAKRANNKQSPGAVSENDDYKSGSPKTTTTTKDAVVLETTVANTAATEAQKEPAINCYYTGGETAATTDLRDKLKGKDIDQKFDATLFLNEKKTVEKVEYINSYELTAKQKEELTKILKTLCKFNFSINPTTKGLFPYKILYRP